ncbi:MAG TPA: hypothetical protein ACQGQI_06550 [Xylella sp.]
MSNTGLTTVGTTGNDTLKEWAGRDIMLSGNGNDICGDDHAGKCA